ncbi:MAG: PQQ-binding-like beta-propeller repeat protein [Anaerolineae bacterium]|nr:PQQ-binding-like beta-propeller repeat protein [Anaerolineae bacterium]MCX8066848.1 PQQ-binding-like beta-propeller repeat protein [Anaerolineae bacterium]MDW7991066.1 PQQ-binding-like beta-propeller repeat protein [Anaerolineae bacterium]
MALERGPFRQPHPGRRRRQPPVHRFLERPDVCPGRRPGRRGWTTDHPLIARCRRAYPGYRRCLQRAGLLRSLRRPRPRAGRRHRQPVWSFQAGGGIAVAPVVDNGVVYLGSTDGVFYALDAATGALRWTYNVGAPILNSAALSADGQTVYFGARTSTPMPCALPTGDCAGAPAFRGNRWRNGGPSS